MAVIACVFLFNAMCALHIIYAHKYICSHNIFCEHIYQKSIEWFIEGQDFSPSYELAPPPLLSGSCLSFSVFLFVGGRANWRKRGGMSLVIRRRESLVLYKSYNISSIYLEYVVNSDVECWRYPVPGAEGIFKFTHLQVDKTSPCGINMCYVRTVS